MNYKTKLLVILAISICLSVFGFWVDSDPRPADISITVLEFVLMTSLEFVIISGLYFVSIFTFSKVKQLNAK